MCVNRAKYTNVTRGDTSISDVPDVKPSAIISLSRSAHVFSISILRSVSVTVFRSGLLNVPTEMNTEQQ